MAAAGDLLAGYAIVKPEPVQKRVEPTGAASAERKLAAPAGAINKIGNKPVSGYDEANRWLQQTLYAGKSTERKLGSAARVRDAAGLKGAPNPCPFVVTNDFAGFRRWLAKNGYKSETFVDTEWYRLGRYKVHELSASWLAEATMMFYDLTKRTPTGGVVRL